MNAQSSVPHTSALGEAASRTPMMRLRATIVSVDELQPIERARMFSLMQKYYDGVAIETFESDLSRKNKVILLKDQGLIQGFSTLVFLRTVVNGKTVYGVFSGDTVIEKQYWGQTVLGRAFLRRLFFEKLKRPFAPLYWLLLSKGYKTYLMMANNFAEHYPSAEKSTPPERRAISDAFYEKLFPGFYDSAAGVIRFPQASCRLKCGVAEISQSLLASNPRVAFFEQANPEWRAGVELACLARMTLSAPFRYVLKAGLKRFKTLHRMTRSLPRE